MALSAGLLSRGQQDPGKTQHRVEQHLAANSHQNFRSESSPVREEARAQMLG
jgi:hypothetical protein